MADEVIRGWNFP